MVGRLNTGYTANKFWVRRAREVAENAAANPGSGGGGGTPGNVTAGGIAYEVDADKCKVGLNLDADPEADIWLRKRAFMRTDIPQADKDEILAAMNAAGCW